MGGVVSTKPSSPATVKLVGKPSASTVVPLATKAPSSRTVQFNGASCSSSDNRIVTLLSTQPWKMTDMLRVVGTLAEAKPEAKKEYCDAGVLNAIVEMINGYYQSDDLPSLSAKRKKLNSKSVPTSGGGDGGVGYGHGSIASSWDAEKAFTDRTSREEHTTWLVSALTAYLGGDTCRINPVNVDILVRLNKNAPHVSTDITNFLKNTSTIYYLCETGLNNDSLLEIGRQLDFYQAIMELVACYSLIDDLLPTIVESRKPLGQSIALQLVPKFVQVCSRLTDSCIVGGVTDDSLLADYVNRIKDLAEVISMRAGERKVEVAPNPVRIAAVSLEARYVAALQEFQVSTHHLIDDSTSFFCQHITSTLRLASPAFSDNRLRNQRIKKEIAQLQCSLPLCLSSSIFVAFDESRLDALKVLITGPEDTPYSNGLFEFDVYFPDRYPMVPPTVKLVTTGGGSFRFNPNLYADGKVCLSILGTWSGRPEEKWAPHSTLLQVLVSIQALILVKEPYYNEPGYEAHSENASYQAQSVAYSNRVEEGTYRLAIYDQLVKPPPYFAEVIRRHCWFKRDAIIASTEAFLHRAPGSSSSSVAALIKVLRDMPDPTVA